MELDILLSESHLKNVPILVLGNKTDNSYAVNEGELRHRLGLSGYATNKCTTRLNKNIRPIEVFMCSVGRRSGYDEGFLWLANILKMNRA